MTDDDDIEHEARARLSDEISRKISPLLAGHPPEVQSAALADLVAIWLAGYQEVLPGTINEFRAARYKAFSDLVMALVPLYSGKFEAMRRARIHP